MLNNNNSLDSLIQDITGSINPNISPQEYMQQTGMNMLPPIDINEATNRAFQQGQAIAAQYPSQYAPQESTPEGLNIAPEGNRTQDVQNGLEAPRKAFGKRVIIL